MDQLMRLLAPRGWTGFFVRLITLIGFVATANFIFALYFDTFEEHQTHSAVYFLSHAAFVGGPLIAFFLAVSAFQIRLQRRLSRLSRKDGLTGLNNRRSFFDLVRKVRATEYPGVLLMLDADWFKRINDAYGHQAGDHCLKSIAYILRRSLREGDVLGRLGGEEFAIYLNDVTVETARVIGERLTKPITFETETRDCLSVTLSIGAAQVEPDLSIDVLFARADAALYQAKQEGRARYVLWEPAIQQDHAVRSA
ncbi:GGDEF domain-containing protein [Yoonia sp.]|uniref:GGDEF domain-containing protein n=1 Tax=Yoonia sp. TaxID=2212373 RepID=UPI0039768441